LHHFVIPEPQNDKALAPQPSVAVCVVDTFNVLTAIDFDDQFRLKAHKVHEVGTDRLLALEFPTAQSMRAQLAPQQLLWVGLVRSQSPGEILLSQRHNPSPLPLSHKGRGKRTSVSC
jgi:hypothetical protein